MDFYVASYEVALSGITLREYLYRTSPAHVKFRSVSTTQQPTLYGENIFHTAEQITTLLELVSKDPALRDKNIEVRRVTLIDPPLTETELAQIERTALLKQLSPRQQRILCIDAGQK